MIFLRVWRHMKALWPRWTLLPVAPFILWGLFWAVRGEMRWDHVAMIIGVPLVAYTSAGSKRLYNGLLPIGLVGLFYDGMRFVKNVGLTEKNVHVCDLRNAELSNLGTLVGAVCFLTGAVLLLPRRAARARASGRSAGAG